MLVRRISFRLAKASVKEGKEKVSEKPVRVLENFPQSRFVWCPENSIAQELYYPEINRFPGIRGDHT